ncbi:glycine zipper 2TM domain-containing protein [Undibacterium pigrum]|uniref:Glycine zipper 2TM protein n=1 Tax=Undibacterium pigrum TaxID=401470 RepID=A0A318IXW5_9BURK|nr:glycine zipper 2TM domain-containing protein [Undibacterium pigrum]PXX39813.1 glycine zipper 2TM protein [Undibacterium pigrum]
MELTTTSKRIHPLMAGAACSVILVSLLGAAAITGLLPNSNSMNAPVSNNVPAMGSMGTNSNLSYPAPVANNQNQPAANYANTAQNNYVAPAPAPAPAPVRVAQSSHRQPARSYHDNYPAQPVQAKNSPVGIGVGAVIGGLIGSQVGNGNGRTLATIAGAVGGGYVGNEVAKRNP